MKAGLVADTYLEAMSVSHFKQKYEEYELRSEEEEHIARLSEDGDIYNKLVRSLAPEIFGHEDVKKAVLLLLVGAPHKKTERRNATHNRYVAPRGVYTTGRGSSSGVGLTSAVQRDPVTNEMVLEGGGTLIWVSVLLMNLTRCKILIAQQAIHEVMEQQTVSIAKAGITISLNVRTAVLAAANPAWGRYDHQLKISIFLQPCCQGLIFYG